MTTKEKMKFFKRKKELSIMFDEVFDNELIELKSVAEIKGYALEVILSHEEKEIWKKRWLDMMGDSIMDEHFYSVLPTRYRRIILMNAVIEKNKEASVYTIETGGDDVWILEEKLESASRFYVNENIFSFSQNHFGSADIAKSGLISLLNDRIEEHKEKMLTNETLKEEVKMTSARDIIGRTF